MSILTSFWPSAGYIILGFLFVLSLVVFFHELGHFLIGRWCGVKVETFASVRTGTFRFFDVLMQSPAWRVLRPSRLAAMSDSTATPMAPR